MWRKSEPISTILFFVFDVILHFHSVFYKRHELIRQVIKMIVLQLLFDTQHLEHYVTRKIKQFSSRVRIVDNITQALNSSEIEEVIEDRLSYLYSQPESYYLEQLGLKKEDVKGLIKPSIISLCAESAPYVMDTVADADSEQVKELMFVLFVWKCYYNSKVCSKVYSAVMVYHSLLIIICLFLGLCHMIMPRCTCANNGIR